MSGLTSRQQWAHDHIRRCDGCGTWEIVTDFEMRLRAAEKWPVVPGVCDHVQRAYTDHEELTA